MHKKILFIGFIFLLVGCKNIDYTTDYIEYVRPCLNDKDIVNDVSLGYQYYVPKGVKKVHDYDYNQIFLVDKTFLYLYVDVISYYHKRELKLDSSDEDTYYQSISYNGKNGYLKVNLVDDKHFVNVVYHYSKIQFYADEEDLGKLITISTIILNSVKYNDTVIEKVLEGDLGEFSEFTYEVEKPEGASSSFSQFLEEYVQKEDEEDKKEELPDE